MASDDDADSLSGDEYEKEGGKSGTIYLIDSRLSMFTKDFMDVDEALQTRFNIAIKCCRTMMMNKIIAKQKDLVGIVLFGTDKPDPKTNECKHVTLLLEPTYPSADAIKKLDKLLADVDCVELQQAYGFSDDFLLADALWYCSSLFSQSGSNFEDKQILLFTDDCEPHASNPDRAHMARKRAKDLNMLKFSLEVLPMGADFEYLTFYKELVEIVNGSKDNEEFNPSTKFERLLERVNRLDFKKRRYSKIKWNLGNDVSLGVSLYTLYKEASILAKETLYRATNTPVSKVKQTFDTATGDLLLPSDIEEYLSIAGSDIVFSTEDKEKLKKIMEPGLILLGFKPASFASEALHCGSPSFAYPEETLIKGSKELMKALVERCIAKQKVALCSITPRHRAVTKYVCLVPSEEAYDDEGNQLVPCGFHVIPLPFYNDTREQSFAKTHQVDDKSVEIAKQIIKKLKLSYKPGSFNNPKLQQFWAHLEALALEYDAPEAIEDATIPDVETQSKRLGVLADEFISACSLDSAGTKRPSATSSQSVPSKRAKQSSSDVDIAQSIKNAMQNKKVEQFTVAQLKDFLISQKQDVKGMKKLELVQAVYKLQ